VNLGHGRIWILANADDETEAQRLPAFVGRYRWSNFRCSEIRREIIGSNAVPQDRANGLSPAARAPVDV
jgi:hypothetical protein